MIEDLYYVIYNDKSEHTGESTQSIILVHLSNLPNLFIHLTCDYLLNPYKKINLLNLIRLVLLFKMNI